MARRRKKLSQEPQVADIESLTHDGRGVTRINGKTVFVDGALPEERVEFVYSRSHRNYDEGVVTNVISASVHRIEPACEHFGVCGGCKLQHLDEAEQLKRKQQVLLDDFKHIGNVEPESILTPLTSPIWGYRRKARLGVRYVIKKERILVGFRERNSHFLADLKNCRILHPVIGTKLTELAELIRGLSCYTRIPQVEVAIGDEDAALVFRNLDALTDNDINQLVEFGKQHQFQIYMQPKGPDSVTLLWPESASLSYSLPEYDVNVVFEPGDFTQVNTDINRSMVKHALTLLELQATDRVLELFCGLGNFTFAMARHAAQVSAVEGEKSLIERARENAKRNDITNAEFLVANLQDDVSGSSWLRKQQYDKLLLDPPRSGAAEIIPQVAAAGASRIVYVSCNPATLARDAGELVNRYGYKLVSAGVMDMFPHTAHVESIALFVKS